MTLLRCRSLSDEPECKVVAYPLTHSLLEDYRNAALANARRLLAEATLLLSHKHYARAYFLGVASVEEVGKAVQAFDGMGRNLKDPTVSARLRRHFEDHSQKVTSAFVPWMQQSPNIRHEIMSFVNLMIDVQRGREPAMCVDLDAERPRVLAPVSVVRPSAAEDCVRLARALLFQAEPYIRQAEPNVTTRVQDAYFAMKPSRFRKILSTEDFWWFLISRMEAGDSSIETAVIEYDRRFSSNNTTFRQKAEQE